MSLTYTTLQTQVHTNYLKRPDLVSITPSLITMAENEINRRLRPLQMEEITSFTLGIGDNTKSLTAISASIDSVIRVWKTVNNVFEEIVYLDPLQFLGQRQIAGNPGQPNYYTIQGGSTMYFERTADQAYTIYVHISKKFALATDTTNWLSENHEDAYLFGTLAQAEPYMKNDKRIVVWRTLFEAVLSQIEESDTGERGNRNAILIPGVAGLVGIPRPFNINTG